MAKKIIILVMALLIAVGGTLGVVFGVRACNNKKDDGLKNGISSEIKLIEDGETYSSALPLGAVAFSKTQFTSMSYSIDNGAKVAMTVKTGNASEHKDYKATFKGMYYISCAFVNVDVSKLTATDHTIKVYVSGTVDGASVEYQIGQTITFNVNNG